MFLSNAVKCGVKFQCAHRPTVQKSLCSLEYYLAKRKKAQIEEAYNLVCDFKRKNGATPSEDITSEFFWLYTGGSKLDYSKLTKSYLNKMQLVGNEFFSKQMLSKNEPLFQNFDDFICYCEGKENK